MPIYEGDLPPEERMIEMRISLEVRHSPAGIALLPPGTDPKAFEALVQESLDAALQQHPIEWSSAPVVKVDGSPLQTVEEKVASIREVAGAFVECFSTPEPPLEEADGYWRVEGIRHSCAIRATSNLEALRKSSDHVGDWEMAEVTFLGPNPEIIF